MTTGSGSSPADREIHVRSEAHPVAHRDAHVLHDADVIGDAGATGRRSSAEACDDRGVDATRRTHGHRPRPPQRPSHPRRPPAGRHRSRHRSTDAALLVIDGTIAEVGPDATVASPEDARTHDFPDSTALPGLLDAHVHVTLPPTVDPLATMAEESDDELVTRGAVAAERMVRAGITHGLRLRRPEHHGAGRPRRHRRGISLGPRLLVSGRTMTQTKGHCHFFGGEADGVDGVKATVRRIIEEEGADGIKTFATGGGMTAGHQFPLRLVLGDGARGRWPTRPTGWASGSRPRPRRAGHPQRVDRRARLHPALHDAGQGMGVGVRRGRRPRHGRARHPRLPHDLGGLPQRGRVGHRHQQAPAEPGRDEPPRLVDERATAHRRGRDGGPRHGRGHQPHGLRRRAVPGARGVRAHRRPGRRGDPAGRPPAPRGTRASRTSPGRCARAWKPTSWSSTADPDERIRTCDAPAS